MATYPLTERAILLKAEDDVAIAKKEITAGTVLEDAGRTRIEARAGHPPRPQDRAPRARGAARRCAATAR